MAGGNSSFPQGFWPCLRFETGTGTACAAATVLFRAAWRHRLDGAEIHGGAGVFRIFAKIRL